MAEASRQLQLRISLAAPDMAAATRAASSLTGEGFDVLSVSARGLLVAGSAFDIERVFNAPVETISGQLQFAVDPDPKTLLKLDASGAYFPRQPEFFKR